MLNVDIFFCFPSLSHAVIHVFHDRKRKWRLPSGSVCDLPVMYVHTFIKSRISEGDRGVSAVEQLIDRLALFQTRQSAVLPEDRSRIGYSVPLRRL